MVLSNIPEQAGHEEDVETTVNVTNIVKELIHNVLGLMIFKQYPLIGFPVQESMGV